MEPGPISNKRKPISEEQRLERNARVKERYYQFKQKNPEKAKQRNKQIHLRRLERFEEDPLVKKRYKKKQKECQERNKIGHSISNQKYYRKKVGERTKRGFDTQPNLPDFSDLINKFSEFSEFYDFCSDKEIDALIGQIE